MEEFDNDILQHTNAFTISKPNIIRVERIRIAKMAGIYILFLLFWVCFVLPSFEVTFYIFFVTAIIVLEVLSIPVELIRLFRNAKRCPLKLHFSNKEIIFDETSIAVTDIKKVTATHKNAVSKSIYPKNRYVTIKTTNRKYVLWFGTEPGLSYQDYEAITANIEYFCMTHFIPISYEK